MTSEIDHQTKLLAQALGDCILASGIVRSDLEMSGPQLLMFAEDLKAHLASIKSKPLTVLSEAEQKAVLSDLAGLQCLISHHDCRETEADAMGFGSSFHQKRAHELLAIGRPIISEDPDLWHEHDKAAFALRHSERAALAKHKEV